MDVDTESLIGETQQIQEPRRWRKPGPMACGAWLVVVGLVALVAVRPSLARAAGQSFEVKEERLKLVPSFPYCSTYKEDCSSTGCCKVSGHKCFAKTSGEARCNETCTVGKAGFTCEIINPHSVPVNQALGQSLYCFAVYTQNTGSVKPSTELELLTKQKEFGVSLFACDEWDVYADVSIDIGGYTTLQVVDSFNEFHQIKRKATDSWVNWAMFYQVWLQVRKVGKWKNHDYVIKVDADAVFHPGRLRNWLSTKGGESPHGVYFENCPNVQYGFFGNLEVISKTGAKVLDENLEECHEKFAPCANKGCDWQWGPWGEDVFVQRCMDHHYVDKMEGWDMTTDGACESDRPEGEKKNKKWHPTDCTKVATPAAHPFKDPKDYFKCMSEMTGGQYTV